MIKINFLDWPRIKRCAKARISSRKARALDHWPMDTLIHDGVGEGSDIGTVEYPLHCKIPDDNLYIVLNGFPSVKMPDYPEEMEARLLRGSNYYKRILEKNPYAPNPKGVNR